MNSSVQIASSERNKEIYTQLDDRIIEKRFSSPFPIRRHAHEAQWQKFVDRIPSGSTVLDAGCGPGVLSVLLAQKGCIVMGIDLSEPNIIEAKKYAEKMGVAKQVTFMTGDAEQLPVADKSFDYVVSSHVLEHLPDFTQGVRELARVARTEVITAIPTCLTLGGMALLGGDSYWTFSRRSWYALPFGLLRVICAFLLGEEGVNESYAGSKELIHIWRFPWVGKRKMEAGNLKVMDYCCSAIIIPYLNFLLPLTMILERFSWFPFFRNFGHGTTYFCVPIDTPSSPTH